MKVQHVIVCFIKLPSRLISILNKAQADAQFLLNTVFSSEVNTEVLFTRMFFLAMESYVIVQKLLPSSNAARPNLMRP